MRLFVLLFCTALPLFAQSLYTDTTIIELRIEFYYPAWKDSLLRHVASETDIPARLLVQGIVYDSIGIRYKGNSSYNIASDKKPFNLSIDAYRENQLLYGYKTLNLNNFFKDPTCVREKIAYKIASQYMPAVHAAYVKLFINNEYWGLYLNVQQINKIFLREHFSTTGGNLYKGDPPKAGAGIFGADLTWHGTDTAYYRARYELKTNEEQNDWSDIVLFINRLNTLSDASFESEIPKYLNVDRALWYLAYCNIFVNLDSYIGSGHNYYLYNNPLDGMNMILWDINEVLGTFSSDPLSIEQRERLPLLYKNLDDLRPLVRRLLSIPALRNRYYTHCRTILNESYSEITWSPHIQQYQSLITNTLAIDTKKLYTMDQFTANVRSNIQSGNVGGAGTIPGILSFINNRRSYLLAQPEMTLAAVSILSLNHTPLQPTGSDSLSFSTIVQGAKSVNLWWSVNSARFQSRAMVRSASDIARYHLILGPFTRGDVVRYYIEAVSNNGTVTFYPERAEYETETLTVSGRASKSPIVINELMASNTKTIKDPQNEYDDWLELYNTSNDIVSVAGLFLSDELTPKSKWRIPATTVIPPKGFLLVWADEDTSDVGGLHANFKISKSGEALFLWDSTGAAILDSTTFGTQIDDKSWARVPDGSGSFVITNPSPDAANAVTHTMSNDPNPPYNFDLAQNYPNPFNPSTVIQYELARASRVKLNVYSILGQELATLVDEYQESGPHRTEWSTKLPSGVYYYRIEAGEFQQTRKLIIVK
ncbi:MAG: CotH kinase family protein [bacterium]